MATRPASIFPVRVVELWAVGDVLGPLRDIDAVTVALAVDLPVEEVPWLGQPRGAQQWANATRLDRNPIVGLWRSVHAPVWNHRVERPALVWDAENGVAEKTLAALHDGAGERVRLPAPGAEEWRARLTEELAVSVRALRDCTAAYEQRRWSPGKLEPVADALWRASEGYLDVLDALHGPPEPT